MYCDQISDEMHYINCNASFYYSGAWKSETICENVSVTNNIISMTIFEYQIFSVVSDVLISLYICIHFSIRERQKQTRSSKVNVYSTSCSCFYDELSTS